MSTLFIQRKKRLITLAFALSIVLLGIKFYAYYLTTSNAILTDALESVINVFASGFAFYSIYLSSLPKDINHPYGHGKIEFFSAGFEGGLIVVAGFFIIYQAILGLLHPPALSALPSGMLLLSVTVLFNGGLGYLLFKEGRRMDSLTLTADGQHLIVDAISSVFLIIGVGVVFLTGWQWMDPALSIAFAGFILYNGYKLLRKSIAGLMDESDPKTIVKVVQIINDARKENWIDIHNMRIQKYGADLHVDCHITLPYYFNLKQVHDEVADLERALDEKVDHNLEIFTHSDPCQPGNCCKYCSVNNCPSRVYHKSVHVEWTPAVLVKNQKHYEYYVQQRTSNKKGRFN